MFLLRNKLFITYVSYAIYFDIQFISYINKYYVARVFNKK